MLNFIMSNALAALMSLPELISSPIAIIIYLFVVLAAIAVIVITVIVKERGQSNAVEYKISYDNAPAAQEEKEEAEETGERFYMLSTIDSNEKSYMRTSYDKGITLKELCDNFRNYAASNHGLYYDIEDIRRF
ncbi:MAG: hypothetical protein IKJ07_01610, partial [Clostridia bacterium]|nr:hypothetical protein [Clostridia bacterium]